MEEKLEEGIYLNPHEDRIIGVINDNIYLKSEYQDYVVLIPRELYIWSLNMYINQKQDYCKRYDHFCGVCGEIEILKYRVLDSIILNECIEVEDDGKNEGIELKKVSYPVYFADLLNDYCDMEHG